MSFWELAVLHASGRLRLDRTASSWIRNALATDPRLVPLPVTSEIALTAGGLAAVRDPGDSIIYATAVEHDAPLVTGDRALRAHDPARTLW
jgi:PIN domain nuclease of toxin-antitoxin system